MKCTGRTCMDLYAFSGDQILASHLNSALLVFCCPALHGCRHDGAQGEFVPIFGSLLLVRLVPFE